jgi:hypothetical protein
LEFTYPDLVARTAETKMRDNAIADSIEAGPVAATAFVAGEKERFFGGANGMALVEKFESDAGGEAGGFVLRFLVADEEQSRIPYGVNIENGVEVHLAGETEARAMLVALRRLLNE